MRENDTMQHTRATAGPSRRGPGFATWIVLALLGAVLLGAVGSPISTTATVRPVSVAAPELIPAEVALLSSMDDDARARFLLQRRLADRAELAALLARLQALRNETARRTIDNIR